MFTATHLSGEVSGRVAGAGREPAEAAVETKVVSNRVLPGHSNTLQLVVREIVLDGQVDIIETHLPGGVTEDGQHDELLVTEAGLGPAVLYKRLRQGNDGLGLQGLEFFLQQTV